MSWWKRVAKVRLGRELEVPKVDAEKLETIRLASKHMSQEDRDKIKALRNELTASGFLDREEEVSFEAEADMESAFQLAGEQGVAATSQLPTYNQELDDEISSATGGENMLLDDFDEYEGEAFDVYQTLRGFDKVSVSKTDDSSIELRLPDGSIIQGHIPGK